MLEQLDQIEGLYDAYEAVNALKDVTDAFNGFFKGASGAIDDIVKAGKFTDKEKLTAINKLLDAVNKLYGEFQKGDSATVAALNKMQGSEIYKAVKKLAEAEREVK